MSEEVKDTSMAEGAEAPSAKKEKRVKFKKVRGKTVKSLRHPINGMLVLEEHLQSERFRKGLAMMDSTYGISFCDTFG